MFFVENTFIRTKSTKNLPKNKNLINFSKENRKAGILAEALFWQKEEYDLKRENDLKSFGLVIFKIADIEVKRNLSWVMISLRDFIIREYGIANFSQ